MGRPKKEKRPEEGTPDWMVTYGDMTSLLLTFFILLVANANFDTAQVQLTLAAFNGLGVLSGGNTLQPGRLAELGNSVMSLPSMQQGRAFDTARKRAVSEFEPEIRTKKIRIQEDERGLVITLAADAFFKPSSADVEIEETRNLLQKISALLSSNQFADRKFRIEGHTDASPTDPDGPFPSNWELSAARSANVLHYLVDYGVHEEQFQIAGLADTVPIASEETPEGRAYNRRVDIIILAAGHL